MSTYRLTQTSADFVSIALNVLCLIHCLALPFLAVVLPSLSLLAENESIHKLFVVGAVLASGLAMYQFRKTQHAFAFALFVIMAISLLAMGAFVEALHDFETPLTVTGAVLLSAAHIWRLNRITNRPNTCECASACDPSGIA